MAQQVRIAIATNGLGKSRAGHCIRNKLKAAKRHGFEGVEVAFECLEVHSQSPAFASHGTRPACLKAAARDVWEAASDLTLEVIALNPFGAYDGLVDEKDVEERLNEAELWLQLCDILQAPILQVIETKNQHGVSLGGRYIEANHLYQQVASCIYPIKKPLTGDPRKMAANMRKLGQLAQKHNKIVAFEGVAFGVDINTWQKARDIVRLVDLPNVRHCVDTFHIAAGEAGDPLNMAVPLRSDGMERLQRSLEEFKREVRPTDIGYFQLSDGAPADRLQRGYPLRDLNQPPYMTQSRNCRPFPGEGVLPVMDVAKAVFETGYRGWVSVEVFHTDLFSSDET